MIYRQKILERIFKLVLAPRTYEHGTIIRTVITCKKIPLEMSIEFGMALKQSATRYKQKTEIFLVIRPPAC